MTPATGPRVDTTVAAPTMSVPATTQEQQPEEAAESGHGPCPPRPAHGGPAGSPSVALAATARAAPVPALAVAAVGREVTLPSSRSSAKR